MAHNMRNEIANHFAAIGARVEITPLRSRDRRIGRQWMTRRMSDTAMLVDVNRDSREECFTVTHHSDADVDIIDVNVPMRHLLLTTKPKDHPARRMFLCGRDESHWFVAAIPDARTTSDVRTVTDAMNALKPEAVWESIRLHNLPESQWNLRHTKAFIRQGEWFFIPRPQQSERGNSLRKREPLSRGVGSQMHWCEEMLRVGGETVWVSERFPNGLNNDQINRLAKELRKSLFWRRMRRNGNAFARGWVRHRDHATIHLAGWHEVAMNTESRASAMRHVVFLD
jgi:hypothetical protein